MIHLTIEQIDVIVAAAEELPTDEKRELLWSRVRSRLGLLDHKKIADADVARAVELSMVGLLQKQNGDEPKKKPVSLAPINSWQIGEKL